MGVALALVATVLFCMTPILVELVNADVPAASKLGSTDVGGAAAKMGAVVISLYCAVWTWPRMDDLVLQPVAATGAYRVVFFDANRKNDFIVWNSSPPSRKYVVV
jgi:hypothetical protein